MIDYAYEKEKKEAWTDAMEEWVKDQMDELIRYLTPEINERKKPSMEPFSYKNVRELLKRLL